MRSGIKVAVIVLSAVLVAVMAFVLLALLNMEKPETVDQLATLRNDEGGVSIDVTPLNGGGSKFDILMDTHEGSLDFDLLQNTVLTDSNGNAYKPSGWDGSPPGGHHRSGILSFPVLSDTKGFKLVIKDVYGVPERIFEWR